MRFIGSSARKVLFHEGNVQERDAVMLSMVTFSALMSCMAVQRHLQAVHTL